MHLDHSLYLQNYKNMYKSIKDFYGEYRSVLRLEDGTSIPFDEKNVDYQEYLRWLAEGNTPLTEENQE